MGRKPTHDYKKLLEKDENLRRWYTNLKRGSEQTAAVSLRRLGHVCRTHGTSPDKLACFSLKEATDFLMDLVTKMDEEGMQPSYIDTTVKVVKSWLGHNRIKVTERIKMPDKKKPTKRDLEQSPTPEQFNRVLDVADPKQKVECSLLGFSGLRPESPANFAGTDGLVISDIPDLEFNNESKQVIFTKVPAMVVVRPVLSKAGHQYFTFLPQQGCDYLKALLELRMGMGETLKPSSPVITSIKWHKHFSVEKYIKHITTKSMSDSIKVAIGTAGFDWRPYILRTYFATRMMMAEADGLIIRDWRVFWMGHVGDIEHVYTLNKKIPDDLVDKMRKAFGKATDEHLATTGRRNSDVRNIAREEVIIGWLTFSKFSKEEIEKLGNLSQKDVGEIMKLIEERRASRPNNNSQKVVHHSEVKSYLEKGWNFKTWFSDDRTEAIMSAPNEP